MIRFPKSPPEPKDDGGFVEVRRCRDQSEALVLKSLFESKGIPCVLRSHHLAQSVHPFSVGDQGEVIVLVPAAEAARARLLLARVP